MSSNRVAVFPTRMALASWKDQQKGAARGYDLLKKKRDALKQRFFTLCREILDAKNKAIDEMQEARKSLDEARWAAGDFRPKVLASLPEKPVIRARAAIENVAGVQLPRFRAVEAAELISHAVHGLSGGGREISIAQDKWRGVVDQMVVLAGLQTEFIALDSAIKLTARRVNALENVLLPRIQDTIAYIESELDEMEREEIFRIKKVLEVKRKHEAAEKREREAASAASSTASTSSAASSSTSSTSAAAAAAAARRSAALEAAAVAGSMSPPHGPAMLGGRPAPGGMGLPLAAHGTAAALSRDHFDDSIMAGPPISKPAPAMPVLGGAPAASAPAPAAAAAAAAAGSGGANPFDFDSAFDDVGYQGSKSSGAGMDDDLVFN